MREYYVGEPNILNKELFLKRASDILDSRRLTNGGKYVKELEYEVEQYLNVGHAIAVSNATVGLELALRAFLKRDSLVFVPSFTFIATIHAIKNAGGIPCFIDIEDDFTIELEKMAKNSLNNPFCPGKAILACNLFGNICNIERLKTIAKENDIKLIYDSAHALGCLDEKSEKYVGNFGDCEIFSLHATKLVNSGEGGIITTNNGELADKLRRMRNFGFSPTGGPQGEVIDYGTNAKMSELTAALGLTSFESIQEIIGWNYENFKAYKKYLPKEVSLMEPNTYFSNFSYIIVEVDQSKRDSLVDYLQKHSIFARTYFQPCHLTTIYKTKQQLNWLKTERKAKRVIALPTGINVDKTDIKYICEVIGEGLHG